MIKINLSTGRQQVDISNIGGFDFSKIKIKALALVFVLMYLPDFFVLPMWQESIEQKRAEVTQLRSKLGRLKDEVGKTKDFEKQIQDLKIQEQNLGQKLMAVKEAISIKRNPAALLLYMAKNTPADLWIKELNLENDSMVVKGEASNYTSIGEFVTNMRSSVFIKEANITSTVSAVRESDKQRVETFEVKFGIGRYDQ
jgi:Tfp pilus assembly protein PilN